MGSWHPVLLWPWILLAQLRAYYCHSNMNEKLQEWSLFMRERRWEVLRKEEVLSDRTLCGINMFYRFLCKAVSNNIKIYILTYLLTYFLTYSMVQSPHWEANRFSASPEIPAFYGTWRLITAFTSVRHLSLSWARSIHSMVLYPTSWRSNKDICLVFILWRGCIKCEILNLWLLELRKSL